MTNEKQKALMPAVTACAVLIGSAIWASTLLPIADSPPETRQNTAVSYTEQVFRDYGGYVARFNVGESEPIEVYDVAVQSLPAEEQQRLEQGVTAHTEEEFLSLLEDYTS